MPTHERYTNQDFSNTNETKIEQTITSKKKYVSPKLTELCATEKIEGGTPNLLNENTSGHGLVSGATS